MSDAQSSGLEILEWDDPERGILAYAVHEGAAAEEDTAPIWAHFDAAKAARRRVRIYAEVHALPSVSGGVFLAKLKRLGTILSTMERMAIVGDKAWMGIYEKLVDPITKADVRHFTMDQRDEAIAWIREDGA